MTDVTKGVAATSVVAGASIDYGRFLDCVHCGLCTAACPTYLETGNENDSPRGRIYLMRGVVDGRLELTPAVRGHLDLCLDCRSCETACPSGVQYGRLIEPFRVDMQKTERPGWFQRLVLYGLFPFPGRLRLALVPARLMQLVGLDRVIDWVGLHKLLPGPLGRMYRLLPRLAAQAPALPTVLPAEGEKRARVGLFSGCVGEAMFSETNRATARVLQANGCEVVIPRGQGCCGAIHYHSGSSDPAVAMAMKNVDVFPDDLDAVIVNVAGCGSMLKDYGHMGEETPGVPAEAVAALSGFSGRVRDVSEFLAELGLREPTGEVPWRATYHDACHLAHAQGVRQAPRELLEQVPGLELVPLPESDICCGAAGSYNLTQPEMSDRLVARKVGHIDRTRADVVISGNAGCTLQLQAAVGGLDRPVRVVHPIEVLDLSYRGGVAE
ncbi:MAG: heterodisulfide reductase-related iron-sulfur binding cluster [Planctomycetota bacterium]|nr:heterodisulfide reductase-related iron-sulfur binding cluster [Planctomycetota bacterium]